MANFLQQPGKRCDRGLPHSSATVDSAGLGWAEIQFGPIPLLV
ncbi:MAG: hypothetical protein SFW36_22845 [Leptolyngbyaceae cyanobacterium bins.59]|nr:hypothetical protein [Leptolyngbyaceae cyanobacterium bins.59]